MEREFNSMQALCGSGCGFYGNPATEGLCSLCFKENLKKKQQVPSSPSSLSALKDTTTAQPTISHIPSPQATDVPKDASKECSETLATASNAAIAESEVVPAPSTSSGETSINTTSEEKEGDKDVKKKKNRCATCRKKVGLTGFECRCGELFCATHRYSDKHDCSFDYREMGAQEIKRNNPVVLSEKIQKI